MTSAQLIKKGLRSPEKIPSYLGGKFRSVAQTAQLEAYRRRHSIARQKPLIHELVDTDEFVLVMLDACRHDFFSEAYQDYLSGELTEVWASGRWTAQYCSRTWTEEYDLVYVNSMPVFSDFYFELRDMDFRPSEHIKDLTHIWESEWDASLGTTPAKEITNEALRRANADGPTRIVAHYAQPHVPYVGEKTIGSWSTDEAALGEDAELREVLAQDRKRPTQVVLDKIYNGEVSDSELKEAYRSNLEYVLAEVERLVHRVDCPVVITGDHGEHLGEGGRYLHEEDSTVVRRVPWFVVSPDELGTASNETDPSNSHKSKSYSGSEEELEERLRNLGYK